MVRKDRSEESTVRVVEVSFAVGSPLYELYAREQGTGRWKWLEVYETRKEAERAARAYRNTVVTSRRVVWED